MKFGLVRRMLAAERHLDREIDKASAFLCGGAEPELLARAYRRGRPARHPNWPLFAMFAAPIGEARQHIADERERYEQEISGEIEDAVKSIKRRSK